jgi:hypothetical protein
MPAHPRHLEALTRHLTGRRTARPSGGAARATPAAAEAAGAPLPLGEAALLRFVADGYLTFDLPELGEACHAAIHAQASRGRRSDSSTALDIVLVI